MFCWVLLIRLPSCLYSRPIPLLSRFLLAQISLACQPSCIFRERSRNGRREMKCVQAVNINLIPLPPSPSSYQSLPAKGCRVVEDHSSSFICFSYKLRFYVTQRKSENKIPHSFSFPTLCSLSFQIYFLSLSLSIFLTFFLHSLSIFPSFLFFFLLLLSFLFPYSLFEVSDALKKTFIKTTKKQFIHQKADK